ncbi:hypothetical protein [Flavobacterium sp.]|uniref:hypothetical protein n=1 Tax=Flavobacterium sp. TaxID=239 RepID=UPI00262782A4|nr:hypothetical protein [Flavobacterium sp.]
MNNISFSAFGISRRRFTELNRLVCSNLDLRFFLNSVITLIGSNFPGKERPLLAEMVEHALFCVRENRKVNTLTDSDCFILNFCTLAVRLYEKKLVAVPERENQKATISWTPLTTSVTDFENKYPDHEYIDWECNGISAESAAALLAARTLPVHVFSKLYQIKPYEHSEITEGA